MAQSGQYDRQFTWLQRSYAKDAASGAQIPSWNGSTILWGSLVERGGSYGVQWGASRNSTDAVIVLLQFPAISEGDRLQDTLFNHTYICRNIQLNWEDNTTTVNCYRIAGDNV